MSPQCPTSSRRLSPPAAPGADCHRNHVAEATTQVRQPCESRVSTDSDLDLESEEDEYDGYVDGDGDGYRREPFSADLLVQKLEQVQRDEHSPALWEGKYATAAAPPTFLQQLRLFEESYWEKMRRISQWRESTHQSEASSEYSLTESDNEPLAAASSSAPKSRKRRLSAASSVPDSSKRVRVSVAAAAPSGTPLDSRGSSPGPAYSLSLPAECDGDDSAAQHPRAYVVGGGGGSGAVASWLETLHICTACDAAFASRQCLRRHARTAPDACKAAVTYVLE